MRTSAPQAPALAAAVTVGLVAALGKLGGGDAAPFDAPGMQRAREILRRKYSSPPATLEERARRARFLQSRGFSYEVIRRVVIID